VADGSGCSTDGHMVKRLVNIGLENEGKINDGYNVADGSGCSTDGHMVKRLVNIGLENEGKINDGYNVVDGSGCSTDGYIDKRQDNIGLDHETVPATIAQQNSQILFISNLKENSTLSKFNFFLYTNFKFYFIYHF
jgi:hypothetical protein